MNLDKLYADFTEKVLPLAAQGLQLTKDYFTDLAGRYVQYLIITDVVKLALAVTLTLIVAGFAISFIRKGVKQSKEKRTYMDPDGIDWIMGGVMGLACALIIGGTVTILKADDLIKVLTVPEIRIYQELKPYMK